MSKVSPIKTATNTAMVVYRENPLVPAVSRQPVPIGETVLGTLNRLAIQQELWPQLTIQLNGVPLTQTLWPVIRQKPGTVLTVTLWPGDDVGAVLRTGIVIAATVAAAVLTKGASLAVQTAVIGTTSAVAGFAATALIPPQAARLSNLSRGGERESTTLSITGAQNRLTPGGPVPVVYGVHKLFPPYAAQPYTEVIGEDEYLVLLFCCGPGPLELHDFKIGDTPIADYRDVQIEVYRAIGDGAAITLYNGTATNSPEQVLVTAAGGPVVRTLPEADRAVITFHFPALAEFTPSGALMERTVKAKVQYRLAGTDDPWMVVAQTTTSKTETRHELDQLPGDPNQRITYYRSRFPVNGPLRLEFFYPGFQPAPNGTAQIQSVELAISTRPLGSTVWQLQRILTLPTLQNIAVQLAQRQNGVQVEIRLEVRSWNTFDKQLAATDAVVPVPTASYPSAEIYEAEFIGKKDSLVRHALEIQFPQRGIYEYQVTRLTEDSNDTTIRDEMYLAGATSFIHEFPVKRSDLALIALRIRANEQLNGVIDNFNCVARRYLRTRENGVWAQRLSRSPAWAFYDALTNPQVRRNPLVGDFVNVDAIEAWHDFCDRPAPVSTLPGAVSSDNNPLLSFDAVIDYRSSIAEVMQDIARVGRASAAIGLDMRRTVVIDQEHAVRVLYFGPHNSRDFAFSKTFIDVPHGLRMRLRDASAGYEERELIAYRDGYNEANANNIETVELFGVTGRRQAWQEGRKMLAEMQLRPNTYTLRVGLEHLLCERGDMVAITHDVIGVGLGTGRINSGVFDTFGALIGLNLEEPVLLAENTAYHLRWQVGDGTSRLAAIDVTASGTGDIYSVLFTAPLVNDTASHPRYGDVYAYGLADKVADHFIVRQIRLLSEYEAELSLVDAAPAVHKADTEVIPLNTLQGSIDPARQTPGSPEAVAISEQLTWNNGVPTIRLTANWQAAGGPPSKEYALALRLNDQPRQYLGTTEGTSWELGDGFNSGDRVRLSVTAYGFGVRNGQPLQSIPTSIIHDVRSAFKAEPPADVTQFRVTIQGEQAVFTWQPSPSYDTAGYELRYSQQTTNAEWTKAVAILPTLPRDSNSAQVLARKGTYLLKSIDIEDNESVNAVRVVNLIDASATRNVLVTYDESTAGFNGQKDSVTVDNGALRLAGSDTMDDWQSVDDIADWDTGGQGLQPVGTYFFAQTLDLGAVFTVRATATIEASSFTLGDNIDDWPDIDSRPDFDGDVPELWQVELYLRGTNDDPFDLDNPAVWSEWDAFTPADYNARDLIGRAFQFKLVLRTLGQFTSPLVETLKLVIDVPDRVESGQDIVVPAGGTRITFDPAFQATPAITPVLQDLQAGEYPVISNRNANGFDIEIINATSDRTVDYLARGFGYQLS